MTNNQSAKTYGILKGDTPFNEFFPDSKVPILSLIPIAPTPEAPPCYVIDPQFLTEDQKIALAQTLYERRKPECTSLKMAIQAVNKGLSINHTWFSGVQTSDVSEFFRIMDDRL